MALKKIVYIRASLNSLNKYAIRRYKQLHSAYMPSHLSYNYPSTFLHLLRSTWEEQPFEANSFNKCSASSRIFLLLSFLLQTSHLLFLLPAASPTQLALSLLLLTYAHLLSQWAFTCPCDSSYKISCFMTFIAILLAAFILSPLMPTYSPPLFSQSHQ